MAGEGGWDVAEEVVVFSRRELREGENVAYRLYKAFPANTSLGLDSKTGMM